MHLREIEQKFVEAYSFDDSRLYDEIAKKLNITRLEVSELYKRTKNECDSIQRIKNRYNSIKHRGKNDFSDFRSFYIWFNKQKKQHGDFQCFYCGTKEESLKKLFEKKALDSKKFNGTLHIERLNSDKPYNEKNCVLACSICNNAKSDFISCKEFKAYFAQSVKSFIDFKLMGQNNP